MFGHNAVLSFCQQLLSGGCSFLKIVLFICHKLMFIPWFCTSDMGWCRLGFYFYIPFYLAPVLKANIAFQVCTDLHLYYTNRIFITNDPKVMQF